MNSETAITPARQTVPTSRELEAALAAIPKGRGEPEMNGAILDLTYSDATALYDAPPPTWVAGALIEWSPTM